MSSSSSSSSVLATCLILLLAPVTPFRAVLTHNARSAVVQRPYYPMQVSSRLGASAPAMSEERQEREEPESLYTTPKFEFDAVTITALLGAAIAFQFFVLANL